MNNFGRSILLAALTGLALPSGARAQDYVWITNASWTITITSYTGPGGTVIIPDTITDLPVAEIGQDAFYGRASVTRVTIGDSLTSIGMRAFYNCTSLTNVTIGDSVASIDARAFGLCGELTDVLIGESVSSIGEEAFYYCTNLAGITVDAFNFFFSSLDGVLFNRTKTTLIRYPAGKTGPYTVPNSVASIEDHAFYYCANLTEVTLPNNVTSIGYAAFGLCFNLTGVTIGDSMMSIGDYAFYYCTSLTRVYFLGDAPSIGSAVFSAADNATVYYLPGTTGWGSTFGGRPAVLWLPQIQTAGVQTNQFGFDFSWANGMTVVIDACSNPTIADWTPLQTNTLTGGSGYFSDTAWSNHPTRFYRLRWP